MTTLFQLGQSILASLPFNPETLVNCDMIIETITTLFAAFLGAYAAFWLEDKKRKREEVRNKVAAGNHAIFILARFFNNLLLFRRDVVDPERNNPVRMIAMRATEGLSDENISISLKELQFLIDEKESNLLMELLIQESRFKALIQSINLRSKLHFETIQPLLERGGFREGEPFQIQDLRRSLGERNLAAITRSTDDIIEFTDGTIKSLKEAGDSLRAKLVQLFPGNEFLRFQE